MCVQVSLVEALCGAHFYIKTMDDRQLQVTSEGAVIKPDSWMSIKVGGALVSPRSSCFGSFAVALPIQSALCVVITVV